MAAAEPRPLRSGARTSPEVPYWHLWKDEAGISRFSLCHLTHYALAGIGDAAPQWNLPLERCSSQVVFTVQPVGWIGEWHENPEPQWIVVLSGRWFIESMDGARIEQGAGEFSFGEDQHCVADAAGRRGHRSGTLGAEPAALMTVRMGLAPGSAPCRFR